MSARRCGGAISNSPSTAIHGTGRSPGISTRPRPSARGRASSASWKTARRAYVTNYAQYTIDGALAVDFVGRYESLEEDLNRALELAGAGTRVSVPRVNVTPNKDEARSYRSYYSPDTQGLVAEWYEPEIALLGYGF